ncbi:MAG: FprA family A-type flavoprotein [Clostridiales bacterium]|nr:FprA family A-type flavoprotein [Clostridiales bacterium]
MKIEISESIKYIGAGTRDIDLFESQYILENGMSYNSYVIIDEKIAVMDTVDKIVSHEWMENLKSALDGRTPDYLVVHHLEPDHSACISEIIEKYPTMKIVCSAKAKAMMPQFADVDVDRIIDKKEGDTLELGNHTLHFILTPMVHWPEVMMSYESSEKVLFSADAFGKFGVIDADEDWACEARRYYFNIVGKYGVQVQNVLKKAANLDIKTICPLHGPILTDTVSQVLDLYNTWSSFEPEDEGVFIAYASMHGNTAEAAKKMKELLLEKGCPRVAIADLSRDDIAECVEDAFRHSTLLCMASSYDGGVFAPMSDFIHHLKSKAFQNRKVAIVENGSWAPSAARTMKAEFEQMKNITFVGDTVTIKTRVTDSDIEALDKLAQEIK